MNEYGLKAQAILESITINVQNFKDIIKSTEQYINAK